MVGRGELTDAAWARIEPLLPAFGDAVVEGVAAVLGDTRDGFTGPQIAGVLQSAQVPDPGNIISDTGSARRCRNPSQGRDAGAPGEASER